MGGSIEYLESECAYWLVPWCTYLGNETFVDQHVWESKKALNVLCVKQNFVIACLCQKGGGTWTIFMCYWMNWEILATQVLVFMPYWNFEYTNIS